MIFERGNSLRIAILRLNLVIYLAETRLMPMTTMVVFSQRIQFWKQKQIIMGVRQKTLEFWAVDIIYNATSLNLKSRCVVEQVEIEVAFEDSLFNSSGCCTEMTVRDKNLILYCLSVSVFNWLYMHKYCFH